VEDALFKSFDAVVRSQLAPTWHRVPRSGKQIINDLRTLRKLLT
jgi:DNA excision repair protein ERCC-4